MTLEILLALAIAGAIYFGMITVSTKRSMRNMTALEVREAQLSDEISRERREDASTRLSRTVRDLGYEGQWFPLAGGVLLGYLGISTALSLFGAPSLVGLVVSLPLALLGTTGVLGYQRRKRLSKFDGQLLQAIRIVVSQLEAGDTPFTAFQKAALLVENPLRQELEYALASKVATESLASKIAELGERFPGRAMTMLVTALEIDDRIGVKLAPALRQAQITLERQFELSAEATAEISQAKAEFFGISIVIGLIALVLAGGSVDVARDAYFSPVGAIVIAATVGNYVFGVVRTLRIFKRAGEGR